MNVFDEEMAIATSESFLLCTNAEKIDLVLILKICGSIIKDGLI